MSQMLNLEHLQFLLKERLQVEQQPLSNWKYFFDLDIEILHFLHQNKSILNPNNQYIFS